MKDLHYRLIQARKPEDPARVEEHQSFARFLGVPLSQVHAFNLITDSPDVDALMDGVDAVLVGGSGEFGVTSDVPWMKSYIETLGHLVDRNFPLFGSCFGFQGLCVALGVEVRPDEPTAEIGTYDISLTEEGRKDPLFGTIPDVFKAQEGHKDRAFAVPAGATLLARSEKCPYQAIRVGEGLQYATQFHPELDGATQRSRFRNYFELYMGIYGEEKAMAILADIIDSPESNSLLSGFAQMLQKQKDSA